MFILIVSARRASAGLALKEATTSEGTGPLAWRSEYSRSDSDIVYDYMIDTHYRFLGCRDEDRIGRYVAGDHISLRSNGQLSDVACLISRPVFERYEYRGDYAEDLDLGVRLIKDGHRVAMLASIKVIHSHNRSAYYYLRRSFVDVVFLVDMFEDFVPPSVKSTSGLMLGIVSTAAHLSDWNAGFDPHQPSARLQDDPGGVDRRVATDIFAPSH